MDFQTFTDTEDSGDEKKHVAYMVEGINALERAGVDFVIIAANSPHAFFDQIKQRVTVPLINIAEVTAKKARSKGMKKLLLTGIKFTMQSRFYPEICNKNGIDIMTPSDYEQTTINSLIFKELCAGTFKETTKEKLLRIINKYDVDGVILGCTELPLILREGDGRVPFLNTLEIHAEAALEESLLGK
ncbi:amino acid racemase [Candidatus Woesearchaeota archaeon]|nr:amino acid racemase [Candidatus Woesearchaeota archaeon]